MGPRKGPYLLVFLHRAASPRFPARKRAPRPRMSVGALFGVRHRVAVSDTAFLWGLTALSAPLVQCDRSGHRDVERLALLRDRRLLVAVREHLVRKALPLGSEDEDDFSS